MHPWIAALFDDTTSAIAIVTIHGEDRFYCNDSFARAFGFDEHQANKWLKDEAVSRCGLHEVVTQADRCHDCCCCCAADTAYDPQHPRAPEREGAHDQEHDRDAGRLRLAGR